MKYFVTLADGRTCKTNNIAIVRSIIRQFVVSTIRNSKGNIINFKFGLK